MKTKNIILPLVVVVFFLSGKKIQAQNTYLYAGTSISSMSESNEDGRSTDNVRPRIGYHVGLGFDIDLFSMFSLQPNFQLTTKGNMKRGEEKNDYYWVERTNLFYLNIPILLNAKVALDETKKANFFMGPNIGVAIYGESKDFDVYKGEKQNIDVNPLDWGKDRVMDDYKRVDLAWQIGSSIQLKKFLIRASYDLGVKNISAYTGRDTKVKNNAFLLSIGFAFGGGPKEVVQEVQ